MSISWFYKFSNVMDSNLFSLKNVRLVILCLARFCQAPTFALTIILKNMCNDPETKLNEDIDSREEKVA